VEMSRFGSDTRQPPPVTGGRARGGQNGCGDKGDCVFDEYEIRLHLPAPKGLRIGPVHELREPDQDRLAKIASLAGPALDLLGLHEWVANRTESRPGRCLGQALKAFEGDIAAGACPLFDAQSTEIMRTGPLPRRKADVEPI